MRPPPIRQPTLGTARVIYQRLGEQLLQLSLAGSAALSIRDRLQPLCRDWLAAVSTLLLVHASHLRQLGPSRSAPAPRPGLPGAAGPAQRPAWRGPPAR